jgi:aminoglycoside/choline kinase family phosphotransferase
MQDAEERIRSGLRATLGREIESIEPIEAGLGSRRFFRIKLSGAAAPHSLVARVEGEEDPAVRPAGTPPEPPLEPIRAHLAACGLPVPACLGVFDDWMLLEDVGDASLERAASRAQPEEVASLYREACALVPRLQAVPARAGVAAFSRRLDDSLFRYKAEQVIEWVLPLTASGGTEAGADVVRAAFDLVGEVAREAPHRLAHRDYKAANLHVRPGGAGGRLVLIDLQGAFQAPPEYDLVCLLRDAHVELDEALVASLLERTRPTLPDAPDPDTFARRFALLTLTRNGKDLARYLFAARVRRDRRYLRLVPRALRTLQAAARIVSSEDHRLERLADLLLSIPEDPCAE